MKQLSEEEKTAIPDLSSLRHLTWFSRIQDQTHAHTQECENPTQVFQFHTFFFFPLFLIFIPADLQSIVFSSQHSLFSLRHSTNLANPPSFRQLHLNRLPWWSLVLCLLLCCQEAILTFTVQFWNCKWNMKNWQTTLLHWRKPKEAYQVQLYL